MPKNKAFRILGLPLWLGLFWVSSAWAVEVQGHRGARARMPENSLAAFDYALQLGVDTLELDLGVSKDGVLVINHDLRINADLCLGPDGKPIKAAPWIHSLTVSEIQKFDCGSMGNPKFPDQKKIPGTRIPTLDQLFELVAQSPAPAAATVGFNIETKIEPDQPQGTVGPEEFARLVVAAIQKHRLQKRVVVQSFDFRTLREVRKLDPSIALSALFETTSPDWIRTAREYGVQVISPEWKLVTPTLVKGLHAIGVRVIPWTANDSNAWKKLLGLHVDGIISDDPGALIEFLKTSSL